MMAIAALTAMMGGVGCVAEDLSNCPTPVNPTPDPPVNTVQSLKLRFVPQQMDVTPTQGDLKRAMVYVFDSSGAVYRTWQRTDPEFNTQYDTSIILDAAQTYRLVAWINPIPPYTLSTDPAPAVDTTSVTPVPVVRAASRSALTDGRLKLTIPESQDITERIPMLFYGNKEQVIAPTTDTTIDIPLVLDTYELTATIKGVPYDGSQYRLQVNDTNGAYDFNNNFIETTGFDYQGFTTAPTGGGTGDIVIKVRTLRLAPNRSPMISIVNMTNGTVVFPSGPGTTGSTNLMELINQTGVDLTTTYNLNIEVTPPSNEDGEFPTTTTIRINGWNVVLDGGTVITNS